MAAAPEIDELEAALLNSYPEVNPDVVRRVISMNNDKQDKEVKCREELEQKSRNTLFVDNSHAQPQPHNTRTNGIEGENRHLHLNIPNVSDQNREKSVTFANNVTSYERRQSVPPRAGYSQQYNPGPMTDPVDHAHQFHFTNTSQGYNPQAQYPQAVGDAHPVYPGAHLQNTPPNSMHPHYTRPRQFGEQFPSRTSTLDSTPSPHGAHKNSPNTPPVGYYPYPFNARMSPHQQMIDSAAHPQRRIDFTVGTPTSIPPQHSQYYPPPNVVIQPSSIPEVSSPDQQQQTSQPNYSSKAFIPPLYQRHPSYRSNTSAYTSQSSSDSGAYEYTQYPMYYPQGQQYMQGAPIDAMSPHGAPVAAWPEPRARGNSFDDTQYIQTLVNVQLAKLDQLSHNLNEAQRYCDKLQAEIDRRDTELEAKRRSRMTETVTEEDLRKTKEEGQRLRTDIMLMTREIDMHESGNALLGVVAREGVPGTHVVRPTTFYSELPPGQRVPFHPSLHQPNSTDNPPNRPPPPRRPPPRLPPTRPPPPVPVEEQKWNCSVCTFENHAALDKCEMCEFPRKRDNKQ